MNIKLAPAALAISAALLWAGALCAAAADDTPSVPAASSSLQSAADPSSSSLGAPSGADASSSSDASSASDAKAAEQAAKQAAAKAATGSYKDQLNGVEKDIYAGILQNLRALQPSFTVAFSAPQEFDSADEANSAVTQQAMRAYEAFYRDHPEVFWVNKEGQIGVSMELNSSGAKTAVSAVSITVLFTDPSDIPQKQQELNSAVSTILQQAGGSDYAKVKAFHDAIIEKCEYDMDAKNTPASYPDAYEAYGALVGGKAVCEGYAKAFKVLCDRAGIPCVLIGGTADNENHMWNYVKISGSYYLVDATFDDPVIVSKSAKSTKSGSSKSQGSTAAKTAAQRDQYFLKGADSTQEHIPSADFIKDFQSGLTDPTLSKEDYTPTRADTAVTEDKTPKFYTVSYSSSSGGRYNVSYAGVTGRIDRGQSVPAGSTLTVSAAPDNGYVVESIEVAMPGGSITETESDRVSFNLTGDCDIAVRFAKIKS